MSGKPAARVGDPTACPKTGHGNNPISAGSPDVLFDGLPAARLGDPTGCGSPLSGNLITNVLINGKPVATLDSLGDHGNMVIGGSGSVLIGNTPVPASFSPPASLNLKPAAENQALATPSSRQSPEARHPTSMPSQAPTLEEKARHNALSGLEEEEEEEELDSRQAVTLRIGVFFDGTGNNASNSAIGAQCRGSDIGLSELEAQATFQRCKTHHLDPDSSYANDVSNIWRLYDLYRDDPEPRREGNKSVGYIPIYVTGIGTETSKRDSLFPGKALGRGATGVLGKVDEGISFLAQAINNYDDATPGTSLNVEFDIFGFSRGAAAARHFANQILQRERGPLGKLHRSGALRLPSGFDWQQDVTINFIGLFDTVAAVGGWDDWGDPKDAVNGSLNIHLSADAARQVVHLVARDDHRRNFALNQVLPMHREIVLPGAHSDLGGGYQLEAIERVYLTRPTSSWVPWNTDPRHTPAYQQAEHDTELARNADLLDPIDRTARLETDIWEQFLPASGGRNDRMKYVLAAPYLERRVYGHLSLVYLRVMHALATEAGVPLEIIDEQNNKVALPNELVSIGDKLLAWSRAGGGSLDEEEERLLRQRYIHLSANWNAGVGRGSSSFDIVFINAPAESERALYTDTPPDEKP